MLVIRYCFPYKVIWILPFEWLRWLSIVMALCLSGSVLVMTFWPAVRDDHPKIIAVVLSTIVALNVLLAVGCKVSVSVIAMMPPLHHIGINYKITLNLSGETRYNFGCLPLPISLTNPVDSCCSSILP